jgi:uncharacterized membrane protein YeiH
LVDVYTVIDLIAATSNAFFAGLLARRPDHYRHFTRMGIVLLAIGGGILGGVTRDIILNKVPAPISNPLYLPLVIAAGLLAAFVPFGPGLAFRDGSFRFVAAFSLPWYATIGAFAALEAGLPVLAAVLIGVIGATAGRYFIDITCGVTPKQFVRGEWFTGTALLTAVVFVICYELGLSLAVSTALGFVVGFTFRYLALTRKWEEPEPWEPPALKVGEVPR